MLVQSIILLALTSRFLEATDVGYGVQVMKTGCSINATLERLEETLMRIEETQCGVELKIGHIYTRLGRVEGRQCSADSILPDVDDKLGSLEMKLCSVNSTIIDLTKQLDLVNEKQDSIDIKLVRLEEKHEIMSTKLEVINSTTAVLAENQDLMESKLGNVDVKLDIVDQKQDSMGIKLVRLEEKDEVVSTKLEVMDSTIAVLAENQDSVEARLSTVEVKLEGIEEKLDEMHTLLKEIAHPAVSYTDCTDALLKGVTKSGVYEISPDEGPPFMAFCEQEFNGGGWTVFQRREKDGIDFYRVWSEYKNGFGELDGDHWLGNDYLHRLTKNRNQSMTVRLQYPDGPIKFARYSSFAIESEANKYQLKISGFEGDTPPGDSMTPEHHNLNNMYFSTKDRDNDHSSKSCALYHQAAWWYWRCTWSNLNGDWHQSNAEAVYWLSWGSYKLLQSTTMMLRTTPHT